MTLQEAYEEHEKTGNIFVGNNGKFERINKQQELEKVTLALKQLFSNETTEVYIPKFR